MDNTIEEKLTAVLDRLEKALTSTPAISTDWTATAFRWRRPGYLQAIHHPRLISPDALLGIDHQKDILSRNTQQFVHGYPANNALLWGARGTGKSTLVRAMLETYAPAGLRLIEVEPRDLVDLPDIVDPLRERDEKFIIFSDDLSFERGDPGYKALKAVLDGSVASTPNNVLIYATSNRRHLLPEFQQDNDDAQVVGTEIHYGEAVEEKISLSERFGLWLAFHPFSQDEYLAIVREHLDRLGCFSSVEDWQADSLRFSLERGSRSGRVAEQFARDWAGQQLILEHKIDHSL